MPDDLRTVQFAPMATYALSAIDRAGPDRPSKKSQSKRSMNEVQNFITNPNADPANTGSVKPQNLKDFFQDWINRGFPD
jgi:hypothetical protein